MSVLFTRPLKAAVFGFLALVGVVIVAVAAGRAGLIDDATSKRAAGLIIGVMMIVTGNYLPKLRPLKGSEVDASATRSAERRAGWTLVLAGIAYVASFALAPLDEARRASSLIGVAALMLVALDWTSVARSFFRRSSAVDGLLKERRRIALWLLFAVGYILVSAFTASWFDDTRWARDIASWSIVVFVAMYSLVLVVVEGCSAKRSLD